MFKGSSTSWFVPRSLSVCLAIFALLSSFAVASDKNRAEASLGGHSFPK